MDNSIIVPPPGTKLQKKWKSKAKGLQKDVLLMPPIPTHYNPKEQNLASPLGNMGSFRPTLTINKLKNDKEQQERKKRAYQLKETSAELLSTIEEFTRIIRPKRKKNNSESQIDLFDKGEEYVKKEGDYKRPAVWHCCKTPATFKGNKYEPPISIPYIVDQLDQKHFGNLQHCENHWVCPVCARAAAAERAEEIYFGLQTYIDLGFKVNFVTLTMPHYMKDKLKFNLDLIVKGFDFIKNHRSSKELLSDKLIYIRALEPTFGKNGWHPHIHAIFVTPKNQTDRYIEHSKKMWLDWLDRNDRYRAGAYKRAFVVEPYNGKTDQLTDYVCKWGIVQEISHTQQKVGRKDKEGFAPFEILGIVHDGLTWDINRDPKEVFKEYAKAFKGRSMVRFSTDFFKDIGIDIEELREEIKQKKEKEKTILFEIDLRLWHQIMDKKLLPYIHTVYENNGLYSIHILLLQNHINYLFVDGNKFIYNDIGQISMFNSS